MLRNSAARLSRAAFQSASRFSRTAQVPRPAVLCTVSVSSASTQRSALLSVRFYNTSSSSSRLQSVVPVSSALLPQQSLRQYSDADLPPHEQLAMPALSPTMEKGTLVEWKKAVGDEIQAGDVIAVVETDKATIDFESTEDGYLAKQFIEAGTADVPVGQPLAIVCESEDDVAAFANVKPSGDAPRAAPEAPAAAAAPEAPAAPATQASPAQSAQSSSSSSSSAPAPGAGGRIIASPAARSLAASNSVNLSSVSGTGPNGRIVKSDILQAIERGPSAAAASAPSASASVPQAVSSSASYEDIPASGIRKVTAARLTESKQQVPHYYLTMDCNVEKLAKLRAELNSRGDGKYKLSVNDFIVKACAIALRKVPTVNSQWMGDRIRRFNTVDINVAVNTPKGLFTPLINNADHLGLAGISGSVRSLAEKARDGTLSLPEMQPGTFTISNLGMFGLDHFAAVINPPQAAILAVGAAEERVVVDKEADGDAPSFKVTSYMKVTLSADHRVVDGAAGAEWLSAFKKLIEEPTNMLL